MKWSKYIVEESDSAERVPTSQLQTSRRSNVSKNKAFQLKSCDKVKLNTSSTNKKDPSMLDQQNLGSSSIKKIISKISNKAEKGSACRERGEGKEINIFTVEPQELLKLTDIFVQEFHKFLNSFFQTYEHLRVKRKEETVLKRKITQSLEQSLTNYFSQNHSLVFRNESPLKESIIHSPLQKRTSRAIQFKNQKIHEKDGIVAPHENIDKVHKLLERNQREHRFARTAVRSKTKRDRSADSSVEDIMERSFNDNHKYSKSRIKVSEAIYKFNKVLNTPKGQ